MKKIILKVGGIFLLLLLVIGIFFFFYYFSAKKRSSSSSIFPLFSKHQTSVSSSLPQKEKTSKPVVIKKIKNFFPTVNKEQRENNLPLRNFSLFFAEQLGSYSTEGNYANLKSLLPYLADSAKSWAEKIIQSQPTKAKEYYGVTTKALRVQSEKQGDNWQVKVLCQRIITQGQTRQVKVQYQNLFLTIKKSGKKWQVTAIHWGKPFTE